MGSALGVFRDDHELKVAALRKTPFFVLFSDEQLAGIAKYFKYEHLKEGALLGSQAMVVVVEGELAVSTLVPQQGDKKNKAQVSERLCVKGPGDFFSRPSRELVRGRGSFRGDVNSKEASAVKIVEAFDFTTIRAIVDTKILKLEQKAMDAYLATQGAADAGLLQTVLSTDIRKLLKNVPFLRQLEPSKLTSLAEMFVFEAFEAGYEVIKEGDVDDDSYLLLAGELEATAKVHHEKSLVRGSVQTAIEPPSSGEAPMKTDEKEEAPTEVASKGDADANEERFVLGGNGPSGLRTGSEAPMTKKVPMLKPAPSMRLLRKSSNLIKPQGDTVSLGKVAPGSYFGEMSLMVRIPRTASVTASEKCLVAKIRGKDFHKVLQLTPDVLRAFDQHAKERMVRKLYAFRLPFFAGIEREKIMSLASLFEINQFKENDVIMREKEVSGKLHILINGEVNVSRDGEALVRLSEGSYFGEISILTDRPHLATVSANTACVTLSIGKEKFGSLFADSPNMSAEFQMRLLGPREIELQHVLRHTLGLDLFTQHLETEYTREHLDFYFAVMAFRAGEEGALTATDIKQKYIGPESETPVNVSASMSQAVLDAEEGLDMFNAAHDEVYALMKRDNFERFKKSPLYDELMEAIQCYTSVDLNIDEAASTRADFLAMFDA
ncbi:cAMP-dependent protein kinase regulatory subunit [Hondaea fermentalgiana]|uniref:cAMP-dependent protein kinase regulatory subunit n=1 Tax=Hondaea fermentalgiana TaxID=2315210 RepID=A0A2R5FZH2_9STRA|nr:cAMP-dependent protein kinase regulatory subunit [Hondaea fermentalgiana]|eukprot:GBG24152.1 cAMP-dependent protein kinase regulatory subunit [Hondaea fermentalgiana]